MTDLHTIPWRDLRKGQRFTPRLVDSTYRMFWPERWEAEESLPQELRYAKRQMRGMQVKARIESERASEGLPPLVMRYRNYHLEVLTDSDAVGYLATQATAGLRKHARNVRMLFTAVDATQLDERGQDELQVQQAKHALIAGAIEGCRRQVIRLRKAGQALPPMEPPPGSRKV